MIKTQTKKEVKPKVEKPEVVQVEQEIVPVEAPVVPADFKSKLTKQQTELIKNTIAKGASDDELKMFLYVCQRTGLDPFTKQIHLVPRWDSRSAKEVRMPITGIDGLRSIAERTGAYAGNDDPAFDDETKPQKATVTVYKMVQGQRFAFTATARWSQYFPGEKQGFMWNKMPHLMLGKCAEALALRKAFPSVMSGLYVAEEMGQAVATGKPEPRPYDKALGIIAKMATVKELEEAVFKITGSDKYTAEEKSKVEKAVDQRIVELRKEPNAPKTIPVVQPTNAVGEKSSAL